jgi:UDP-N-acetylmuramate--alanine ligase
MGAPDTVVFSSAIKPDNPEYAAAAAQGSRLWHRSAALAALMLGRTGIAVAGTHGKTTTSGMIVTALQGAGLDPSYCIGSTLATTGRSAGLGSGDCFVVEADESDGTFLQYPARLVVVTNIGVDHLDNWLTADAYRAGFGRFARGDGVEWAVLSADDPGSAALAAELAAEGRQVVTFGVGPDDNEAAGPARVVLQVPGVHNRHNAAAALAVGEILGADPAALVAALGTFRGTARRFELKGEVDGIAVYDDYAHHPDEIAATLAAARTLPHTRVVAAFQPHLFSRTRDFADAFGAALAQADAVVVTDVYPAREEPIPGVTGELVADAVRGHGGTVTYVADLAGVAPALAALARPGDLVLTLGAGSITTAGPQVVALLEAP